MTEFFDKYFNIKHIMEEKKKYKEQMKRVDALPKDYQFVFKKIQNYMWKHAGGDGMDILHLHYELLDLFEQGVADGKSVLEITGEDVAAFCDELLKSVKTYTEKWHNDLNEDIMKKIGKEGETDE